MENMLRWQMNNMVLPWSRSCCDVESCERPAPDPQFNVVEVLRIAQGLEHKAARFYVQAAGRFPDPQRRDLCYGLAAWRAGHEKMWARVRRAYSERTGEFGVFDPDNYVLSNPQVMASLTCFASPKSYDRPTGHQTVEQITRDAMRRTREAIIFYEGLKGFAQNSESRAIIDRLIREENRHIRLLSRAIERMRSTPGQRARAVPSHRTITPGN
jgi:rubrerythrin